jgi:predicted site-specific integrase-resolvase
MSACLTLNLTDYWTPEELAGFLSVTLETLKKWRSIGRGPAYVKMGRRAMYPKQDVLDWIERQKHNGDRAQGKSMVFPVSVARQRVSGTNRFSGHTGKRRRGERAGNEVQG